MARHAGGRDARLGGPLPHACGIDDEWLAASPGRPDAARSAVARDHLPRREAREQQEAARSGSDAAAGRAGQRLGGAAAAARGQGKHETPPNELRTSWDWLDDVDERFMHERWCLASAV